MQKQELTVNLASPASAILDHDVKRLSQLNELSRALVRASTRNELCDIVLDAVSDFLNTDRVSIMLFDTVSKEVELVAAKGQSENVDYRIGARWPISAMSADSDATDQTYYYQPNLANSKSALLQRLATTGLKSALSAPLLFGNTVLGRLNIMSRKLDDYADADAQILIHIASILAPMLNNLELLRQAKQRNAELENSIEELRELRQQDELRYLTQFALDSIPQAIFWLNKEGQILHASEGAANMLGYTPEECCGMNVRTFVPSFGAEDGEERNDLRQRQFYRAETLLTTRSGDQMPAELQLSYVKYGNQEYQFVMASDITERREMEIQLRRQLREEALIRDILALTANRDDFQTTMGQLCRRMAEFYDIQWSDFALLNEAQTTAQIIAEYNNVAHVSAIGTDIPIEGNPIMEYILVNQDVWVVRDDEHESQPTHIRSKMAVFDLVSIFIVPIFIREQLGGTIAFGSKEPWDITPRDIELAREVASQISNALYRLRLLDQLLEASRALESSQKNLSEVLGKLLIPICIVSSDGEYIYANDAFGRMLGTDAEYVMQKMIAPDIYVDPTERYQLLEELHRDGEVNHFQVQFQQVSGEPFWAATSVYMLQYYGEPVLLSSVVDLSDRIQTEEILRGAKEEAEAANRTKSLFLSNMTHELRTPMNGVLGMTSLLFDTALDANQRKLVNTIRTSGDTLLTIINDILDFSKIEANKLELEQVDFELATAIDECVQLIQPTLQAKGLEFSLQIDSDLPQWIVQDVTRVRQILTNLLTNATKFTEQGEISVRVSRHNRPEHRNGQEQAEQAQHSTSPEQPITLQFSIEDTGIGIPMERRDRLFQPFSQVDASTSRRYGGTGLGLVISRQLCELMGGKIWVESKVDTGSTFYFIIEAMPATVMQIAQQTSQTEHALRHSTNHSAANRNKPSADLAERYPLSILLAEDNVVNQKVALGLLRKFGYSADVVANGLEVLDALRRQEYDVILMDIQMPEMDGLQATHCIRAEWPDNEQPTIIAVTANAMGHQREQYLNEGVDDFVSKPIRLPEMEAALLHAAQRRSDEIPPTAKRARAM